MHHLTSVWLQTAAPQAERSPFTREMVRRLLGGVWGCHPVVQLSSAGQEKLGGAVRRQVSERAVVGVAKLLLQERSLAVARMIL